jgi:signal recognition particle subunit SRP54
MPSCDYKLWRTATQIPGLFVFEAALIKLNSASPPTYDYLTAQTGLVQGMNEQLLPNNYGLDITLSMFNNLSNRLDSVFKKIRGQAVISEKQVQDTMREVRMALLEADVNYKVAKDFCDKIAAKATGAELSQSLKPDQHIIKIVHEELVSLLGSQATELNLRTAPPAIFMVVGLQGSGKTTSCGKLALYLKKTLKRSPLLVPADIYRPAAIDQLKTLGAQLGIPVLDSNSNENPVKIAERAVEEARNRGYDTVIIDTAGRLQIDTEMMAEITEIEKTVSPHEILLVADAMVGQESVNIAQGFSQAVNLTGLILTKMDGDARGGAALSMLAVTGKPIKLVGLGEKMDALEVFHPDRLASRILGMGDVMSLIEKASANIDMEESLKLQKKISKNSFTFEDFLSQLRMMKKLGSIGSLMGMIPGMGKLADKIDPQQAESELKKVEAIILSMTPHERNNPEVINGDRRKRIAAGSGTRVQDINNLQKQFEQMQKMMKQFNKMGMGGMLKGLRG